MTMVACGIQEWPKALLDSGNTSTGGAADPLTLDSTSDALAIVMKSPLADTLTHLYFRTGAIPASGGDTVDVRIETVTNGRPSGTLWDTNTNVTVAIADTDDNIWKTATLTAGAVLTVGAEFAIVIASSAGTPSMVLNAGPAVMKTGLGHYPVVLQNATGAYAVILRNLEWIAQFTNAGVRYLPGLVPLDGSLTLTAFNSGSSPNARALRFQVPFKCRCIGARVFVGNVQAGADFTISLFDASGDTDAEALGQAVIDGDFPAANTNDGYVDIIWDELDADNVLAANTTYYIELRPDTANNITLFEAPTGGTGAPANAIRCFPHMSSELFLATRTWTAGTAGVWGTSTGVLPLMNLLIDQVDDGTGTATSAANVFGGSVIQ